MKCKAEEFELERIIKVIIIFITVKKRLNINKRSHNT